MRNFIKQKLHEAWGEELRFNDGKFNKDGANTIYMGDDPIVDFGVGKLGNITVNGVEIPNALFLKGGYSASEEGKGYGTMGLKFIFENYLKYKILSFNVMILLVLSGLRWVVKKFMLEI